MTQKIKFTVKSEWFSVLMIAAVIAGGLWAYPLLPDRVPSHWGITGQVDGWTSRLGHVIGVPGMMLALYLLFLALPYIEPRRNHFIQSWGFYTLIRNFMMAFFAVLFAITTYSGVTGVPVAIGVIVPVIVGVLFILIGNYLGQVRSNFFMGIRTPWTLSSEDNWHKTHRLGSYMFVLGGVLFLSAPFLPVPWNFYLPMTGIVLATVIPILMSYIWFAKSRR
ncbi:MAG: hypothetical protein VE98_C0001G0177 [candidate division Kazan bacterium GW2011_GWA1_50_15]|uniref:DUF1648 domain-containing protein n=2 Tax=Bacteria division Kazan-3B-28 TaxID=1798534 RepID=A0A0G1X6R5_UNCK3|nr:MAG: hypothetical protein VE98_C0001G0177 [candidate division Kazan bacterium GW2011_GWA1_50_15]KKW25547.1 MAG: hypothetical protein VE99_C0001G0184 [candidate division Kazan bacterium GW2011_GWC1_52_13]KKW26853.1 MAG: hypothetical protein VF00_C0002G0178 [candidate division Kazan bacterium GW2011_GWB1_52_7]HAV65846.1 hypothetical protein [Patescibacteria group bacterium]HCR42743.1 hypothetical protein [Patescibacteria group bacterium]